MTKAFELSIPDSDISFVSNGRPSTDRMFPSLFDNIESGLNPRLSTSSDFDDNNLGPLLAGNKSIDMTSSQVDFSSKNLVRTISLGERHGYQLIIWIKASSKLYIKLKCHFSQ